MRPYVVGLLRCPNRGGALRLHAVEQRDDDVVSGVLADLDAGTAYPVAESIALLLSDEDTERSRHAGLLATVRPRCPQPFREAIDATLARLDRRRETGEGRWNREEMTYYDRDVATEQLRERMLADIRARPLWNILLPRRRHLTGPIAEAVRGRFVLEVGCGNARTVSWILPPERYGHRYVGFDISWDRLRLARRVLPAGNFLQASAMNPPLRPRVFHAILGFGVYHHLPSPREGLERCLETVAPGGFVGLHEPIRAPKLLREGSRLRRAAEKLVATYEHSEHDNEIDLDETLTALRARSMSIVGVHYSHSPARVVLNRLCRFFRGPKANRRAYEVTIGIDALMLRTFGRLSSRFGPRAASILARAEPMPPRP